MSLAAFELFAKCCVPWNDEAQKAYDAYKDGDLLPKGELPYRIMQGWAQNAVSNGDCDYPNVNEENKDLDNKHGFSLRWRLGTSARLVEPIGDAEHVVVRFDQQALDGVEGYEPVHPDVLHAFKTTSVKRDTLNKLPEALQTTIRAMWKQSKVLPYNAMIFTARCGWLRVPREDFDEAFSFYSISQKRFNYDIRFEYLEELCSKISL